MNYSRIKSLVDESKLSKQEISDKCGFSRPTLDSALRGADVKASTIIALSKFFNVPVGYFFDDVPTPQVNGTKNQVGIGNVILENIAMDNGSVDARKYYSDSPDVLRAQIDEIEKLVEEKEVRIKEKDAQIKEKDAQIKEKDAQINKLLTILAK